VAVKARGARKERRAVEDSAQTRTPNAKRKISERALGRRSNSKEASSRLRGGI
jgi:hypothetical protein